MMLMYRCVRSCLFIGYALHELQVYVVLVGMYVYMFALLSNGCSVACSKDISLVWFLVCNNNTNDNNIIIITTTTNNNNNTHQ